MAGCSISSVIRRKTANGHRITGFWCKTAHRRSTRWRPGQPYSHHPAACRPAPGAVLRRLPDATESANQQHCIGASYHRGKTDTNFSEEDQQHNRQRLIDYPGRGGRQDVDIKANDACCGALRHPAIIHRWSATPDYAATLTQYASLHEQPDIADSAPVCRNLFMLGALGSRGLCTAPLSAGAKLAAQMSANRCCRYTPGGAELNGCKRKTRREKR